MKTFIMKHLQPKNSSVKDAILIQNGYSIKGLWTTASTDKSFDIGCEYIPTISNKEDTENYFRDIKTKFQFTDTKLIKNSFQ